MGGLRFRKWSGMSGICGELSLVHALSGVIAPELGAPVASRSHCPAVLASDEACLLLEFCLSGRGGMIRFVGA
jgi:hypothetical protein